LLVEIFASVTVQFIVRFPSELVTVDPLVGEFSNMTGAVLSIVYEELVKLVFVFAFDALSYATIVTLNIPSLPLNVIDPFHKLPFVPFNATPLAVTFFTLLVVSVALTVMNTAVPLVRYVLFKFK
jgi:hypothetical protein